MNANTSCELSDPLWPMEVAIVHESIIPIGLRFEKLPSNFASDAVQSDRFTAGSGAESYHLRGI